MEIIQDINLPKSSSWSILLPIDGSTFRIYLIRLPKVDGHKSFYVHAWRCWYLNEEDYRQLSREKGNTKVIKKVFQKTLSLQP